MEDEFNQLLEAFREGFNGKGKNIHMVMKDSMDTLLKMKDSLKDASEEKRQQIIENITKFQKALTQEFNQYAQKEGLNESDLLKSLENAQNFNEKDWNDLQHVKEQFTNTSEEICSTVQKNVQSVTPSQEPLTLKKPKKMLKRNFWIKM